MDADKAKQVKKAEAPEKAKRPYVKPAISSEQLFEGTVLACAKVGFASCGSGPLVSS
jgi:hypothetical protein